MRTPAEVWERAARDTALRIYRLAHRPPATVVPVAPSALPWRDRSFIERTAAALVALGFRDLGCVRLDAGAGQAEDGLRYRVLTSASGDVCATVAVVRARRQRGWLMHLYLILLGRWPAPRPFVEYTTTLASGIVVDTSNSADRNPFTAPPGYVTVRMPADTPLEVQLAAHRREVGAALAARPDAGTVAIADLGQYAKVRAREVEVRNRYRQSIGYVTDAELRALAREHYADIRDGVRAELDRLAREGDAAPATARAEAWR